MRLSKPVCVLLVEANPADAQRIQIALRQFKDQPFEVMRAAGPGVAPKKTVDSRALDMQFKVTWVASQAEALQKISDSNFDILLLGSPLSDSQGLSVVRTVTEAVAPAPIIVLLNQEETYYADSVLKAGAKNTIVKDTAGYGELIRVMRYALQRADVETQNQLLAAGLKATSNAIIITDKDMRIEWVNPAFTQLTGFSFLDALGRRPAELLKSDIHDQLSYQDMWQKLLDTGQWQGEIINRHKDGSLYNADVGISSVRNKDGVLSGYVHVHRDISDSVVRLAISEVLRQCTPIGERFKQVLDILFNLKTFDLQRKGGIFIRAKGENYLSLHTLHGVFSKEFIAKEQRVQCGSCLCGRVAISGKLLVSDDCFCDPRHEHTFHNMQAHGHYIVPITFDTEILGVLFLYTDPYPTKAESRLTMLTQVGEMMALALRQEDARNALEAARDMAMRASLVKSEFLANMSHEIRTPMNGVLGMLDLLRDTPMSATQQDWLETAHSSAHTLLDIINDILDFSKLEAGKFEVELVDFNLVDLVDDICALLAGRAFAAGLELNCALPVPMPPQWRGDPMRIRQVLTNLVGNAVKFTEQGEVSVNVTRTPLTDSLDELRFEVHDTGIGVSEAAQAQLFKPFSQADSATSRRFGGSGLGLSISKKLVELMGGTIGMRSVLGQGSCFWFTLPLAHSENNGDPGQNYDLSGKRVLVVDDNATNRNILINYLGRWGLDASEADSGKAALMALQTAAILGSGHDLILLDMQMPGMDGLAVAQCLAKIPTLAGIPVILLSSGDQFDLADYQGTGIQQRLLKPVRQAQLFDAVANALNGGQDGAAKPVRPGLELPDYGDKKVLVVEDNKINQKVIMAKLAQFCIQPGLAENGQEALDKLAAGRYDLILMDCQMPVLDGYAATRELRSLEAAQGWPRQTVVALTATASEGEREKCLAAGMDDYLSKPIIAEQLQAILETCLGVAASTTRPVLADAISTPPATAQPVWDEAATLAHLEGDRELMAELIGLFLQEGPMQLEALAKSLAADDLAALANTAHAIKGTTAHFYATEAKQAASELEQAARNGGPADFAVLTEAVVVAVTALIGELRTAQNCSGQTC